MSKPRGRRNRLSCIRRSSQQRATANMHGREPLSHAWPQCPPASGFSERSPVQLSAPGTLKPQEPAMRRLTAPFAPRRGACWTKLQAVHRHRHSARCPQQQMHGTSRRLVNRCSTHSKFGPSHIGMQRWKRDQLTLVSQIRRPMERSDTSFDRSVLPCPLSLSPTVSISDRRVPRHRSIGTVRANSDIGVARHNTLSGRPNHG